MSDPIVIVGYARTPMGAYQSDFASLSAHDLGGVAIQAAVARAGIAPNIVDEVLFGNCLMAGQGQAPARQAETTLSHIGHKPLGDLVSAPVFAHKSLPPLPLVRRHARTQPG